MRLIPLKTIYTGGSHSILNSMMQLVMWMWNMKKYFLLFPFNPLFDCYIDCCILLVLRGVTSGLFLFRFFISCILLDLYYSFFLLYLFQIDMHGLFSIPWYFIIFLFTFLFQGIPEINFHFSDHFVAVFCIFSSSFGNRDNRIEQNIEDPGASKINIMV